MASSTSITVAVPLPTSTTHGRDYLLLVINTNTHVLLEDLICEKENGVLSGGKTVNGSFVPDVSVGNECDTDYIDGQEGLV